MSETKFNQFKDILEKYHEGVDYQLDIEESSNRNSGKVYERKENYTIYNTELRKELKRLFFGSPIDTEGTNVVLFKSEQRDLYNNYLCWEQGEENDKVIWKPSQLTEDQKREKDKIAEEVERRRKEQAEQDRKYREQFDRAKRGEGEFPPVNPKNEKNCACCGKSLEGITGTWGSKPAGSSEKFWYCSIECLRKGNGIKDEDKKENKPLEEKKCAKCSKPIQRENWDNGDYCSEWIGVGEKFYHPECVDKKNEIEQKEVELNQQLNSLKHKLENSSNSTEKSELESKIKQTEQELAKLREQDRSVPSASSRSKDIAIFLVVLGTLSALGLITFFWIKKVKNSRKKLK